MFSVIAMGFAKWISDGQDFHRFADFRGKADRTPTSLSGRVPPRADFQFVDEVFLEETTQYSEC